MAVGMSGTAALTGAAAGILMTWCSWSTATALTDIYLVPESVLGLTVGFFVKLERCTYVKFLFLLSS